MVGIDGWRSRASTIAADAAMSASDTYRIDDQGVRIPAAIHSPHTPPIVERAGSLAGQIAAGV
jgi:hypothetical protein